MEVLQVEDVRNKLVDSIGKIVETERIPLYKATGRILAGDVKAGINVPSFPKSAMDGYAVKAADTEDATRDNPVVLKVMGENLAGDYNDIKYTKDGCLRVMTGGFVPEGFDAVIKQEDTDYGEDTVRIFAGTRPYMNYCPVGEDIKKDTLLLKAGDMIDSAGAGVLAAVGICEVEVLRRLKVYILSTGSEIMSPGDELRPGKIYNNSAYMINASLDRAAFQVVSIDTVADEEEILKEKLLAAASKADIVITTGAVSVGKRDIMKQCLKEAGAKILFERAFIQPGTPTCGSLLSGKTVLSLSGNPYAAIANFELYFWDMAAKALNCGRLHPVETSLILSDEYNKKNKLRRLIRAKAVGERVYLPGKIHASSVVSNLIDCNCFIDLPAETECKTGDYVKVRFFG